MQGTVFQCLLFVSLRGVACASVSNQQFMPASRVDTLRRQFAPAMRSDIFRQPLCTGSTHGQRMPVVCAAKELDWKDWFLPPEGVRKEGAEEQYMKNWEEGAKSWAGESRAANLKGVMALIPKFTAGGTVKRAKATAAIALQKAEDAVDFAAEEKSKKKSGAGFMKTDSKTQRTKAEEVAFRFTEAAEAWDEVAQTTEAATKVGWTPGGAKKVQIAARQTANIAAAAEFPAVASQWRIASSAWEAAALELEGKSLPPTDGLDAAVNNEQQDTQAPSKLVAQSYPEIWTPASTLIGLFMISGVAFATFRFCRGDLSKDPLLTTCS